ncbi:hypothetical protein ACFL2E_10755 [Thermodesulfobacteriota bacterium]
MLSEKPIAQLVIIFTAQSKLHFYCRDAICEFVFNQGAVPVNPFRLYEYFLGDRVDRDRIRQANNNLIRKCDELWVFGETIADGVLFEILYAKKLKMPVKYYTVDSRADLIKEISENELKFEEEVYTSTGMKHKELIEQISEKNE